MFGDIKSIYVVVVTLTEYIYQGRSWRRPPADALPFSWQPLELCRHTYFCHRNWSLQTPHSTKKDGTVTWKDRNIHGLIIDNRNVTNGNIHRLITDGNTGIHKHGTNGNIHRHGQNRNTYMDSLQKGMIMKNKCYQCTKSVLWSLIEVYLYFIDTLNQTHLSGF